MSDRNKVVLILVTAPDVQVAEGLARRLVEERLVACVNILPGLRSIYRWQGEVEDSAEALLLLKARRVDVPEISERVRALHPYQTPEVIATEIVDGLADYLDWIGAETERE
ncbi:MAG: divalent-cation tolerance protein CutA [Gemmatimonadota bacterium]|nr:MAG: divalent-cation tolerance protein CutA [Gemmatimonadota bacterium]